LRQAAPGRAALWSDRRAGQASIKNKDEVRAACRSIIKPIVEGLGKLVATFDPEFQERLKNRVLLAGGGSQIKGLDVAIEQAMQDRLGGGKVQRTEEPMYGGANGALKIAHDMPEEYWEKLR
jgi:rod shape-determining protein MreB